MFTKPEPVTGAADALQRLRDLGYFSDEEWEVVQTVGHDADPVIQALHQYEAMHGLQGIGGVDDPALFEHMDQPRCGVADFVRSAEARLCKWPMLQVRTFHQLGPLKTVSGVDEHEVWLKSLAVLNEVCGIELSYQPTSNGANIVAGTGATERGVLAWSYLPCNATDKSVMRQLYSAATQWTEALLQNVIVHELGHALGLDHGPQGAIMQPTANGRIIKPQAWDIQQLQTRYGKPKPKPVPPPTPAPPPTNPTPTPQGIEIIVTQTLPPGRYTLMPISNPSGPTSPPVQGGGFYMGG